MRYNPYTQSVEVLDNTKQLTNLADCITSTPPGLFLLHTGARLGRSRLTICPVLAGEMAKLCEAMRKLQ